MVAPEIGGYTSITGWLSGEEATELYRLAKGVVGGPIVEIGCWLGRSSFVLAAGCRELICIDPFDASGDERSVFYSYRNEKRNLLELFNQNMRRLGVDDRISVIAKTSQKALVEVPVSISGVFIDGDHGEAAVAWDFENYSPRVVRGGWVALHDVCEKFNGPASVAKKILQSSDWTEKHQIGELFVAERM